MSPAAAPFEPFVTLTLRGLYNLKLVAAQYRSLRGVRNVGPNSGGGDGSTICLSRTPIGNNWQLLRKFGVVNHPSAQRASEKVVLSSASHR